MTALVSVLVPVIGGVGILLLLAYLDEWNA